MRFLSLVLLGPVLLAGMLAVAPARSEITKGPVTNLPLPRFVSVKAAQGNVRRGPSVSHRIDWIFQRRNMPVQIIAEYGHWRRVVDRDGAGGWMHYSLLSGTRTVIVTEDMTPLYARPDPSTPIRAYSEAGVIAQLGACAAGWCELNVGAAEGWVEASRLWGVLPGEERD